MKKADRVALERWQDLDYLAEMFQDGPPYEAIYTDWKSDYADEIRWESTLEEEAAHEALENNANWDWEGEVERLNLPDWCKEWCKIESESRLKEQITLIRVKEKQFAKEKLNKFMRKELEKITKDYPTSKECYDS